MNPAAGEKYPFRFGGNEFAEEMGVKFSAAGNFLSLQFW
jgi:hypothetical protein